MNQKLNCILLIDDDEATNFLSRVIISDADCAHHITTQKTAKAALEYIAGSGQLSAKDSQPYPDLIFLDINMPKMDGWEFLGEYKTLKSSGRHTPIIIMLSALVTREDRLHAMNIPEVAGIYDKPMTTEIISSIVAKYFPEYV